VTGVPGLHTPIWQVEIPLQAFPSSQEVWSATAVWMIAPDEGLHESTVHGSLSSTGFGEPGWQTPVALQVSPIVQGLPSVQAVFAGSGV
jgi:hypothetical protein